MIFTTNTCQFHCFIFLLLQPYDRGLGHLLVWRSLSHKTNAGAKTGQYTSAINEHNV